MVHCFPSTDCVHSHENTFQLHRQYWKEIVGYKGDDPLEVWLRCCVPSCAIVCAWPFSSQAFSQPVDRFIKWTQQTFTTGGLQAELVQLLERCTNELKGMDKYKNDLRFIRVWILYV